MTWQRHRRVVGAAAAVSLARRLPWLATPRRLLMLLVCVLLAWPLPGDRAGWQIAGEVGADWVSCLATGSPRDPGWRHAVREGVDDEGIDEAWIAERLGAGVPPATRLISPRQASRPDVDDAPAVPDRTDAHPRTVVVGVIDSGVAADHPDVAAVVRRGADLVAPCGDGRVDVTGHGTAVAGVIASQTHGAAPFVQLLPVRVALADGTHTAWQSAAAIVWATEHGADLLNLSFTNQQRGPSVLERAAVRWARSQGVGVIAAAGNDPTAPVGYPAAYPEVLAVGSVDPGGHMSPFSARQARGATGHLDVVAPGARIVTLSPDGEFRVASGTSLAAPVVTAHAASLLLDDETLTGRRAVERLRVHGGGPVSNFEELRPQ